jgi:hypothetical protein
VVAGPPTATPLTVGSGPGGVGIMPPPVCIPFLAFSAKLEIALEQKPNEDHFELLSSFPLGPASNGTNPLTEAVTLKIGTLITIISRPCPSGGSGPGYSSSMG